MAFDFPSSPSIGQTANGYTWDGEKWKLISGVRMVYISDTPPPSPADSTLWWESDSGILFIYFNDGTSSQWVAIAAPPNGAVRYDTAQTLTYLQAAQARANIGDLKRNYIVNGAMMVSQENIANAGTTSAYHAVDQFYMTFSNAGTQTLQQVASYTPAGSPNRLRITATTADASVAAGDVLSLVQRIEGLRVAELRSGNPAAKQITIQFGCKGPAGTYCVAITNSAQTRSYVAEYVIAAGEANIDVVKSVTIQLDTTGTWLDTAGVTGMIVFWTLMSGSTYQTAAGAWAGGNFIATANQFNFMGTNGNVFELFDVGMYEGGAAPSFQVPEFAAEFLLCQRYYCKSFALATKPVQNAGIGSPGALVAVSATTAAGSISFRQYWPVRMCKTPNLTTYNTSAADANWWDANAGASRAVSTSEIDAGSARIVMNATTTAGAQHFIHWVAEARLP